MHPTDENIPDAFDPTAVELMRALATKAKPAAHLYPFAMYSYRWLLCVDRKGGGACPCAWCCLWVTLDPGVRRVRRAGGVVSMRLPDRSLNLSVD